MPHAKFNWRPRAGEGGDGGSASSTSPQNADGTFSFAFGETWKLANHTLVRSEGDKGCTLDVVLEHDSKVSQLQLVCSASGLQVSVVQKMNAQDFKWLTQMRGTPLPNQPDLFYFRTPEELLTQKIWRLRVKFLFSSASVTHVKLQSLSLCIDKLTRRGGSGGKGAFMGGVPLLLSASSGGSGKPHLDRAGSVSSTVTSTTASLSTTPTGTCTPNGSDTTSLCEDGMSELSLQGSDAEDAAAGSARKRGGGGGGISSWLSAAPTTVAAAAAAATSSGASVSSVRSHNSSSGSSAVSSSSSAASRHKRRTTGSGGDGSHASSSSDRAAIRQLLAVMDQVLAGQGSGASGAPAAAELLALKARMVEHLEWSGRGRLSDEELARTVGRIGSIVQALAAASASAAAPASAGVQESKSAR